MTIYDAMSCLAGGYPIARQNEIRDILAETVWEVLLNLEK